MRSSWWFCVWKQNWPLFLSTGVSVVFFFFWYTLFIRSNAVCTTLDIVREYRFHDPMGSLCSVQDNSALFNGNSTYENLIPHELILIRLYQHQSDDIWACWHLKSPKTRLILFDNVFSQIYNKRKHQGAALLTIFAKNLRWKVKTSQTISDRTDSKVHGANMGPTWVLSAPDGPHELCYKGGEFPVPGKRRAFPCRDVLISPLPAHTAHPMNTQTVCGALGLYRFSAPLVHTSR